MIDLLHLNEFVQLTPPFKMENSRFCTVICQRGGFSAAPAGVSEAGVAEFIAFQLGQFSSSFAATMQTSFDNIKSFIDDRFAQEVQLEPNPPFSESSPVPVDLGPRQAQTDPSVCNPCIAFGAGGQA